MTKELSIVFQSPQPWPVPAHPRRMQWCSTMNLLAYIAEDGKSMFVYRFNEQKVWSVTVGGLKSSADEEMIDLSWRPDGKMIGVILSNGLFRIYESENGLPVFSSTCGNGSLQPGVYIDWVSLEDTESGPVSFVDKLFETDVTSSLPLLAPLPNANSEGTFTTRLVLKQMTESSDTPDGHLGENVLFTAYNDGSFMLNLFGIFTIGPVKPIESPGYMISHSSTADLRYHSLVYYDKGASHLTFSQFSMNFTGKANQNLFEISSISSKIIALLSYISDSVESLTTVASQYLEFVCKTIESFELLTETPDGDDKAEVATELLELLVLGTTSQPAVVEWIQSSLAERGVKKWSKLGNSAYESCRRLVYENLIPATERLVILLSKLLGWARCDTRGGQTSREAANLELCLSTATKFIRLLSAMIWDVNYEGKKFTCFIEWIQHVLKTLTSQDDPKEVPFMTKEVSLYLSKHLYESELCHYLKFDRSVVKQTYSKVEPLEDTLESLRCACEETFSTVKAEIANRIRWQENIWSVEVKETFSVSLRNYGKRDLAVLIPDDTTAQVLLILTDAAANSEQQTVQKYTLDVKCIIPSAESVKSARMINRDALLLLIRESEKSHLVSIDLQPIFDLHSPSDSAIPIDKVSICSQSTFNHQQFDTCSVAVSNVSENAIGCLLHENRVEYKYFTE